MHRIELVSKNNDVDFGRIMLGLDESGLRFLQLHDQFEQVTLIVFSQLRSNIELDGAIFKFIPPEGVDVFGGK